MQELLVLTTMIYMYYQHTVIFILAVKFHTNSLADTPGTIYHGSDVLHVIGCEPINGHAMSGTQCRRGGGGGGGG